mmetsp:Transcript_115005/g.330360  ORF Transcript_115005/g.330360 Transcript_115005/m.330360 type:complete len:161 (+) Transcript_115005:329-811(+)
MSLILILGTNTDEDLSNIDTGGDTNGFTIRVTHTRRETIGSRTRKHFIGTKDMKGVSPDTNVIPILTHILDQVLVNGNTAGFKCLGRDLLLFITHQVSDKGEQIDGCLLGTDIVNTNLGFGNTTAVPRLDVRLVLLVTVATSRTATHVVDADVTRLDLFN